jgi:ABC-type nitrate/sulfonate/bicarbonate transport system substrate-binding protein
VPSGFLLAGCTADGHPASQTPVTLIDWVPNTITPVCSWRSRGYFADEGLQVECAAGEIRRASRRRRQPPSFGVSFQEQVTLATPTGASGVDRRRPATQHFGLRRRGWAWRRDTGRLGGPSLDPSAAVRALDGRRADGLRRRDVGRLEWIETGFTDPLSLLQQGQIDLAWIFYGWQGVQAEQLGIDLDLVMMADHFDCIPDYYTPILIASEETLAERPALVRSFLRAVARGYAFAAERPDLAAEILLAAAPELDREVVRASQRWVSPAVSGRSATLGRAVR